MGKTEQLFQQARDHLDEGDTENAYRLFNQVLNREPSHPEALKYKAIIKAKRENTDEAKAFLRFAIEQNEDDDLYQMLGSLYLKEGKIDKAISIFQKAVELNENNARAQYELGLIYAHHKDDHRKAVKHLTSAIENNPDNADAFFNRGCSYMILQQMNKAEKDFHEAQKLGYGEAEEMLDTYF